MTQTDKPVALPAALPFQAIDTVLLIFCCAITLPMIPALGHFYGGMARRKNVLSAFQQTFILLGVIALQWLLVGYSLAFDGGALGGFCGGWQWFGLGGVGIDPNPAVAPLGYLTGSSCCSNCWSPFSRWLLFQGRSSNA